MHRFTTAVIGYCLASNASVTSWYRTEHRNRAVGGKPTSRHRAGLAVDVIYDTPIKLEERQRIAKEFGLFVYTEHDHDHLREDDL